MDMENIDPKLLKVIALAKQGVGGEKENAIRMVRAICQREGLDYDFVMSDGGALPKKYSTDIKVRSKDELRIIIQVAAKFATSPENPHVRGGYYRGYRECYVEYTATAAQHIDTLNAISVYLAAYRKEKANFMRALNKAFVSHHNLYPQFDSDDDEPAEPKEKTLQERQDDWRAAHVQMSLSEDVKLRKQLGE